MPNLALDFGQTPYEAPELPQVQAPQPSALPPPTSEGFALAPSKAGGIASIADNVMRGFMQGRAMAQATRAARLENTTKALQSSYHLAASQLQKIVEGNNVTQKQLQDISQGKTPEGMDPAVVDSIKQANQAVQGSWTAWTTWLGQHVEQEGGKGKKGKGDGQKLPFLQRLAQGISGKDPAEVSRAIYDYYKQSGPPIYHSLASITATAQQRADALKAQGVQTAATEAGAQDVLDVEKLKKRERDLLLKGDLTPPEQRELDRTRAALENTSGEGGTWKPEFRTINGKTVQLLHNEKLNRWEYPSGKPVEQDVIDSMQPVQRTGKLSAYDTQRAAFAKSLGKSPQDMTWEDEQRFMASLYNAKYPYASSKLALAQHSAHIADMNLQLRQSENNMKDFLDIQKQLTPMDKIESSAQMATDYVKNPTGPGDAALLFAFVDATKSSGMRFNQAEQNMIISLRGLAEGAQAQLAHGYEGTVLGPKGSPQRKEMADIVQHAAKQVGERREKILSGATEFNPAVGAALGATPNEPQHTPETHKFSVSGFKSAFKTKYGRTPTSAELSEAEKQARAAKYTVTQ